MVNPEREIQPFVVNLTGINNNMLRNAPKFYEIAKRIVEITQDCIIVAHNAQFDYRILRTEFKRLGFDFSKETLCTVELSKQLIPGKDSYSLGKLTRSLGIPVSDRHRAAGDAQATVTLFKMLLAKDTSKTIISESIRLEPKHQMEPRLLDIIDSLPSITGVYYMHDANGEVVYVACYSSCNIFVLSVSGETVRTFSGRKKMSKAGIVWVDGKLFASEPQYHRLEVYFQTPH